MLDPTELSGGAWAATLDPPVLLPSRDARLVVSFTPEREMRIRGVRVALIGTETYHYEETETTAGPNGTSSRTVERTRHEELGRVEATLAPAGLLARGRPVRWEWRFHVPDLGPATFEGEVLRCDWEVRVTVDRPRARDAELRLPVRVAQPTALLTAGVIDTGEYGLFEEAPVNVDAHPAQVRLEPVPLCVAAPFSGSVTLETAEPVPVQGVRLELRVHARVTVSGGKEEETCISYGHLGSDGGTFGGPLATHPFTADAPGRWLPSVDLPHGTARATFHLILDRHWARDVHYVRDVALASTTDI